MAEILISQTCRTCGGDGIFTTSGSNNGVPFTMESECSQCKGLGKQVFGSFDSEAISTVLEAIVAEQLSQRADLTSALSNIWDKVKNL